MLDCNNSLVTVIKTQLNIDFSTCQFIISELKNIEIAWSKVALLLEALSLYVASGTRNKFLIVSFPLQKFVRSSCYYRLRQIKRTKLVWLLVA